MKYLIPIFLVFFFAGCDNFLGTQSSEESRASKPIPAIVNTKLPEDKQDNSNNKAKAVPSIPNNK
ncbi:MAG: hypothetical protein ABI543_07820 [Ignavibacteria bacterium]